MDERGPLGEIVSGPAATLPTRMPLQGRTVRLVPISPEHHADALFDAAQGGEQPDPHLWDYMGQGPFAHLGEFADWLEGCVKSNDPHFYAVVDEATGAPGGMVSYLRIVPKDRVIEIGNIWFGARLQRSRQATETIYLLIKNAFEDLGYRRVEWKCNALNERSRRAAERFGFTFEGLFRKHMIVKGRNRDTAWYAMLDDEWPTCRAAFEAWLDPANCDENGQQRRALSEIRQSIVSRESSS